MIRKRMKHGKVHVVPIVRDFWIWLANQGPRESGRVFLRKVGKGKKARYVPFDEFKKSWNSARKACGLEHITFHESTRKTMATRVLNNAPRDGLTMAQEALGHADVSTTKAYLGIKGSDTRNAMEAAAAAGAQRHTGDTKGDQDSEAPIPFVSKKRYRSIS